MTSQSYDFSIPILFLFYESKKAVVNRDDRGNFLVASSEVVDYMLLMQLLQRHWHQEQFIPSKSIGGR
jgi:hypothetical protein